jgi:hypothetical protein
MSIGGSMTSWLWERRRAVIFLGVWEGGVTGE